MFACSMLNFKSNHTFSSKFQIYIFPPGLTQTSSGKFGKVRKSSERSAQPLADSISIPRKVPRTRRRFRQKLRGPFRNCPNFSELFRSGRGLPPWENYRRTIIPPQMLVRVRMLNFRRFLHVWGRRSVTFCSFCHPMCIETESSGYRQNV